MGSSKYLRLKKNYKCEHAYCFPNDYLKHYVLYLVIVRICTRVTIAQTYSYKDSVESLDCTSIEVCLCYLFIVDIYLEQSHKPLTKFMYNSGT